MKLTSVCLYFPFNAKTNMSWGLLSEDSNTEMIFKALRHLLFSLLYEKYKKSKFAAVICHGFLFMSNDLSVNSDAQDIMFLHLT